MSNETTWSRFNGRRIQGREINNIQQIDPRMEGLPFPIPVYKKPEIPSTSSDQQRIDNTTNANGTNIHTENKTTTVSSTNKSMGTDKENRSASPKKENKINDDFLYIMNDLFTTVMDNPHLSHVLDDTERKMAEILKTAKPTYYQYMCYKLYTRKSTWHNIFKFCKDYMPNLADQEVLQIFEFLKNNGFVDTDYTEESIESLLHLLSAEQIKDICSKLKITVTTKKRMIETLLQHCRRQTTLNVSRSMKDIVFGEITNKMGKYVVRINGTFKKHVYYVYLLATFTNRSFLHIDDFLRSTLDLKCEFPEFRLEKYTVFNSREEFVSYAQASELKQRLQTLSKFREHVALHEMGKEAHSALRILRGMSDGVDTNVRHLRSFTAESVYCGILTNICETIKVKFHTEVTEFLKYLIENFPQSHRIGTWYILLCEIYMSQKKYDEAANSIITALSTKPNLIFEYQTYEFANKGEQLKKSRSIDQYCHDRLVELLPVPIRLEDFPQVTIDAITIRGNESGRKRHYQVNSADGSKTYKTVEQVAMDYYIENCGYTDGIHCEGRIIMSTFALFFWDIIYSQDPIIPATFLSKFQDVPLDMYTTDFYKNRKDLIDKRLRDIAENWTNEETVKFVVDHYTNYSHISGMCGPAPDYMNPSFLGIVVNCIGRATLSKIYERIVKDIRQYRSGMPDLFLWNKDEKEAKFVEVKGENDRLSTKQKLWLKYLLSISANAEVCHVHSIGSKRKVTAMEDTNNSDENNDNSVNLTATGSKRKVSAKKSTNKSNDNTSSSSKKTRKPV